MAFYTVLLKKYVGIRIEHVAGGNVTPGHLIMLNSSNAVVVHNVAQGSALPKMFAVEDELQGKTITDVYAATNLVQCEIMLPGEEVYAIIADNQTISIGDKLVSAGDGTLQEATTPASDGADYDGRFVGIAREAVTTSGAVARCRVMIV